MLPQPFNRVLLIVGAREPVAVSAKKLQVLDVALITASARDDVAHSKNTGQELAAAAIIL